MGTMNKFPHGIAAMEEDESLVGPVKLLLTNTWRREFRGNLTERGGQLCGSHVVIEDKESIQLKFVPEGGMKLIPLRSHTSKYDDLTYNRFSLYNLKNLSL